GGIEKRVSELRSEADTARAALIEKEVVIDAELADELEARANAAGAIPADLLTAYERIRRANHGAGAARLIGNTCQGCRLTIPATEVDRIHRAGADGTVFHCDNCAAIL